MNCILKGFWNYEIVWSESLKAPVIRRVCILTNKFTSKKSFESVIISSQGAKTGKDNGFSVLFDIESYDYGYYDEGSEGLKVAIVHHLVSRARQCDVVIKSVWRRYKVSVTSL